MDWDKMLTAGVPTLLVGVAALGWLGWIVLGSLIAGAGGALVQAALIGAAVRGPER